MAPRTSPRRTLRTEIEVCASADVAILDDPPGYWSRASIDLDAVAGVREWIDTDTGEAKPGVCIMDYDGEQIRCRTDFDAAADAFDAWKAFRSMTTPQAN